MLEFTKERSNELGSDFELYKCYTIMNCVKMYLKGLNPAKTMGSRM